MMFNVWSFYVRHPVFRLGMWFALLQHSLFTLLILRCFIRFAYTNNTLMKKKLETCSMPWSTLKILSGNICFMYLHCVFTKIYYFWKNFFDFENDKKQNYFRVSQHTDAKDSSKNPVISKKECYATVINGRKLEFKSWSRKVTTVYFIVKFW